VCVKDSLIIGVRHLRFERFEDVEYELAVNLFRIQVWHVVLLLLDGKEFASEDCFTAELDIKGWHMLRIGNIVLLEVLSLT